MKFENILQDYYIDPKYLSLYRLLYCFIVIFMIGLPSYSWIANSLNYLFDPPILSFAGLFKRFPDSWFFITLAVLNLFLFMLMFLGVAAKWTSLLFSITCIIGHNFWYSFGKIDHLLLWYLAPSFLGFAGWGNFFSVAVFKTDHNYHEIKPNTNAMLILIFALSIGFSMLTSAAEKIGGGWLNWDGEGVRFNFLKNYLSLHRYSWLTEPLLSFDNHFFWKLMDYSALVLEFGFIFSVFRINYFRVFLTVGVLFHMLVLLMFNIPFYSNLIVYLIFIDWSLLWEKWNLHSIFNNLNKEKTIVKRMIFVSIFFTIYWLLLLYNNSHFFTFPGLSETILKAFAIPKPFEVALSIFFVIIFLFTIYIISFHLKTNMKSATRKSKMP